MVWLFFGPTFSILGIISRNRRENFLAWSTLPHHRPRHTLPMSSAPLTHKRFSTVKRQRNQVSGSFTDNFFDQKFLCLFKYTLKFSRTTLKRVGFYECQVGSEFSPRTLLRSLRGPLFPFHRRIAPR